MKCPVLHRKLIFVNALPPSTRMSEQFTLWINTLKVVFGEIASRVQISDKNSFFPTSSLLKVDAGVSLLKIFLLEIV